MRHDRNSENRDPQKEMRDIDTAYEEFDKAQQRFLSNDLKNLQTYYRNDKEMRSIFAELEQNTQQYRKSALAAVDVKLSQLRKEKAELDRRAVNKRSAGR